jgi:hypothetical protein
MGGEYFKGGDIPKVFSSGGGGESPVTTAWANSSTYLKILSCPPPSPPKKYEFAERTNQFIKCF